MITSKQRATLRSLANRLDTVMQIGKGGITESVITQAQQAISNKEMIKVRVLESALLTTRTVSYTHLIRHKTAEGLGLDAATDGTTVTLSGETTTDKLDATDVATQNGYLLYGFNVGSKLITQLGGTVTPNPMSLADFSDGGTVADAVSMNNAALLNIQIWDNDNSSFIKKTISMELKDAAGRVQDLSLIHIFCVCSQSAQLSGHLFHG